MRPDTPGLLGRMRAAPLLALQAMATRRRRARLRRDVLALQPRARRATVVITGLSPGGFSGPGKVDAARFFPPFCAQLAASGVATALAADIQALRKEVSAGAPAIVVNVYREVAHRIDTPAVLDVERQAAGVFNRSEMGPIIADKLLTNGFLTERGVVMPGLAPQSRVFSNSRQASGADVAVLDRLEDAEPGRYNTDFVDTRVSFGGRSYYTCVRLVCVGAQILHAYVRARDVEEGSPSVHAANTPLDARLVEHLQRQLVADRLAELADLAARVAAALGPGFYAHDVLVPPDGGAPLLCETGYKFNDDPYTDRLAPIAADLPSHRLLFSMPAYAGRSASLLLDECARLGYL